MNLELIRAFVEAAEQGSFSAAARALGRTQSWASKAVMQLEEELGVTLFDRRSQRPTLTAEGQTLLAQARASINVTEDFRQRALNLSRGVERSTTLAFSDLIPHSRLQRLLQAFDKAFPTVELGLRFSASTDVVAQVQAQQAELGFGLNLFDSPPDIEVKTLGHVQVVAVVSRNHPLADRDLVHNEELAQHRQLLPATQGRERRMEMPHFSEKLWFVERADIAVELAQAGLGFTVVPEFLAAAGLRSGRLVELKHVYSRQAGINPIDLVWSKRRPLGPAALWLAENIGNFVPEF